MTKILIAADDLTGALDSAVCFAERGLKTLVVRDAQGLPQALAEEPSVLALATGTRERPQEHAVRMLETMLAGLADWPEIVFKKVDSRLKGHVVAELEAVARLTGRTHALVAPAIPEFGRVVRQGQLSGHGIAQPIDIPALFSGLTISASVPDVEQPSDFASLVGDLDGRTLLVGARGLASALAGQIAGPVHPVLEAPVRPLLIAIGSRDPITLAQVGAIEGHPDIRRIEAPNGIVSADFAAGDLVLMQMTPGASPSDSQTATRNFAEALAAVAMTMAPATIFASGGETADSLLAQLGVAVLAVGHEVLPGIPLSRFSHAGTSVALITKSGGFGAPDILAKLVERNG